MEAPIYHLEGVVKAKEENMEDFVGPLDLILHLLSKNKLEIKDIQISPILDQYMDWMNQRRELDLEVASDFVTMASHLVYIKTRMLLSIDDEVALSEMQELMAALEELGVEESGLDRLIKCSYTLLGLISFLTYGKDECRAWTLKKGTKAPRAAGKIHTDIERGFIRAEVIAYEDMVKCGSVNAAKEKGLLRSEGKEYVVQDGDMIYFRFNV